MKSNIENIMFGLYRISRALRKVPLSRAKGLSMHHWFALHVVAEGQANVSSLAKELNVALPTATALVEQLVQDGMVERTTSPTDRRVAVLTLTDEGRDCIKTAKRERLAQATKLFSVLGPDEIEELNRLVDLLASQVETPNKEGRIS